MKVSVIMPVYNGGNILPITIPALLNQTYPREKLEIIIVNDGSTDNTEDVLNLKKWKDHITVISHSTNKGRAITRNAGIRLASGELLIFLDCDIEVKPNFISQHVDYHKNKNTVGLTSKICSSTKKIKNKYYKYIFLSTKRGASQEPKGKPISFKYFIIGCTSIKSEALKKSGLLNEKLKAYGEDLDLAYRLWKNYPEGLFYSEKIHVFMHNVKTLTQARNDCYEYGQKNIPIILKEFPELYPYVAIDYVESKSNAITFKIILGKILFNYPMTKLVEILLIITPSPLCNYLIRYLLASSIILGYKNK